ncbi:MAG: hypothetical protein Q4D61_04865 [Cardiobacteriaceae bacterium]|nr:hypothetical protein [Cardiobacteriaceae bacterium]
MSASKYPYLKVILGFALLGGALGGLLIALFFTVRSGEWRTLLHGDGLLIVFVSGAQFGTAPALLTGLWLAWRRVCRNGGGLLHAAIAGAAFSALGALGVIAFFRLVAGDNWPLLPMLAVMTPTGAVSALLLGWALLPKAIAEQAHG